MSRLNCILIAGLFLIASPTFAQVIYTDVDPDITVTTWDTYFLQLGSGSTDGLYLWKHPNEVVINSMKTDVQVLFDGEYPALLEYGQIADASGTWRKPSYSVLNHEGSTGNWIGVEDGYLAMRYKKDGSWHYAWARLDVDGAPAYFTLKDYATESSADVPILAGSEASADVDAASDPLAYHLRGIELLVGRNSHVTIASGMGTVIYECALRKGESIDLSEFGCAMLFIRINSHTATSRLKLFVGQ